MSAEKSQKIVIDTNVILFDAHALYRFGSADVYIPMSVIEEIDRFKRDTGENGRNARQFSRFIDELRNRGKLVDGVTPTKSKSKVYVITDHNTIDMPPDLDVEKADNRILSAAIYLKKTYPSHEVHLVSKDINLRIKADVYGVSAKDYEPDNVDIDEMYDGYRELSLKPGEIDQFYTDRFYQVDEKFKFVPNEYVIMKNDSNPSHSALGRFSDAEGGIIPLKIHDNVWGIHPRNMEQSFALDSLLNPEIQLVSLVGKAGTGKTLMALAAGLLLTLDESKFQRLLVSRPIFPMGKDIGYLPGDLNEKLNPWMQPIFDNVDFLMGADTSHKKAAGRTQELLNQGLLNIEPLTYIRGRSIPHQYFIVDEAQNLTPHEIKTIITRSGQGTKVILTGDCYQIDNPYLDSSTSGLTYCVEKFKGVSIASHITLTKGERSQLAELASNIL